MRCRISRPADSKKVTVYTAKWCGACNYQVPRIQELALSGGFVVELVAVDSEDPEIRMRVHHVQFVPHIEHLGSEISFNELVRIIKEVGKGGG